MAYHARHPLFASASDDGALHIFHGMVYQVRPPLGMGRLRIAGKNRKCGFVAPAWKGGLLCFVPCK